MASLLECVIGSFACDDHIMHMALAQPGPADTHETRFLLQFRDGLATAVAHAGTQTSDHLVDDHGHRTAVGHAAFDAFRDELGKAVAIAVVEHRSSGGCISGCALEIALAGSRSHGAQRTHTPI